MINSIFVAMSVKLCLHINKKYCNYIHERISLLISAVKDVDKGTFSNLFSQNTQMMAVNYILTLMLILSCNILRIECHDETLVRWMNIRVNELVIILILAAPTISQRV
jgi:hypothetical protein